MKDRFLGATIRVTVSAEQAAAFARRWPCSGIDGHWFAFTFHRRTGDLADVEVYTAAGDWSDAAGIDPGALAALSHDAQRTAGFLAGEVAP